MLTDPTKERTSLTQALIDGIECIHDQLPALKKIAATIENEARALIELVDQSETEAPEMDNLLEALTQINDAVYIINKYTKPARIEAEEIGGVE